jgi:DNA-binding transcriptional ArsR family regulator
MVEYSLQLDSVFGSLADPTRRDILQRLRDGEMSVGEIARPYQLTLAAVSKHLKVLETARLVVKRRRGRKQVVQLSPEVLATAESYLRQYEQLWQIRLDALDELLQQEQRDRINKRGQTDGRPTT